MVIFHPVEPPMKQCSMAKTEVRGKYGVSCSYWNIHVIWIWSCLFLAFLVDPSLLMSITIFILLPNTTYSEWILPEVEALSLEVNYWIYSSTFLIILQDGQAKVMDFVSRGKKTCSLTKAEGRGWVLLESTRKCSSLLLRDLIIILSCPSVFIPLSKALKKPALLLHKGQ